jgi:hypothetical protein
MPTTNVNGTISAVVSYPPQAGQPHAYIINLGPQNAWLSAGTGVSTATGFLLPPNNRIDLSTAAGTVYAIAGGNQAAPYGTANAATSVNGTTIVVTGGGTAFTSGMTIIVEPGTPRQEVTSVSASNAGTVTTSPAMVFAHGSASVFSQWTPYVTTVRAERGAT